MKCQHDLFGSDCSIRLERHWQAAPRASCVVCGDSIEFTKRGVPVNRVRADNPLDIGHIGQFADGRYGCIHCGAYRSPLGKTVHAKGCEAITSRWELEHPPSLAANAFSEHGAGEPR